MALITCKECGAQVSTQAKACPKCGAPIAVSLAKPRSMFLWIVIPVVLAFFAIGQVSNFLKEREAAQRAENQRIADNGIRGHMTPEEFTQYKAREAAEKKAKVDAAEKKETMKLVRQIALSTIESDVKSVLNDPDSARFGAKQIRENPKAQTGFVACGYVNARNALGGYTGERGYIVVDRNARIDDGSEKFAFIWKEFCF